MAPRLTAWSIAKIFNGEDSHNPIVQILGYQLCVDSEGKCRYRFVISDGITSYPHTILGSRLNQMVHDKKLEKYTVVRLNEYKCETVKTEHKVIFLMNLTVLATANEVNKVLGKPHQYHPYTGPDFSTEKPPANRSNGTEPGTISDTEMVNFLNLETHIRNLSTGSINKILQGEKVPNAVLQILGCKRITTQGFNWYRFLISDGVTGYPYAILSRDLNEMVVDKKLERFTIIKVGDWSLAQADHKTVLLHSLTVLAPGNEVNEMLGDPFKRSTAVTPSENGINGVSA